MAGNSTALHSIRRLQEESLSQSLDIADTGSIGPAIADYILSIADVPTKLMIVDNCSERADWKPALVEDEFEKLYRTDGASEAYIFNLDDIPGSNEMWITHEHKFRLFADVADLILFFIEPRHNEPSLTELSVLASTQRYWEKTIVLERVTAQGTGAHYHTSLYDDLQVTDRYFTYQSIADLAKTCCEIYEEIPNLKVE